MAVMFVPTELPETCYVAEAAYWLAFGRLPELYPEEFDASSRADVGFSAGEGPPQSQLFFSELEFIHAGVELDYQRYFKVREVITATSGDEFIKNFENNAGKFDPEGHLPKKQAEKFNEGMGRLRQELRQQAAELDWAISMEANLHGVIDTARARVFDALFSGFLRATGYVFGTASASDNQPDGNSNFSEQARDGEWVQIDPKSWTLRNFDWEKCILTTPQAAFHAVQVKTNDMLTSFPKPSSDAVSRRVDVYPGVVILVDDEVSDSGRTMTVRRPRGRPLKGDGAIRTAVQSTFKKRIRQGEIPAKREALNEDVVSYVEETFGVKISRTTAQSYIAPLLGMPGIVPNNLAGK